MIFVEKQNAINSHGYSIYLETIRFKENFCRKNTQKFIVWCYSFLSGMRLSYLDFGFLDAVNVKKSVFCFLVFEVTRNCFLYVIIIKMIIKL